MHGLWVQPKPKLLGLSSAHTLYLLLQIDPAVCLRERRYGQDNKTSKCLLGRRHCEKCLNAHFPQKPPKMDYINLFYAWEKESYLLIITKDTAICVHNKAHK